MEVAKVQEECVDAFLVNTHTSARSCGTLKR
jgi:hypothetical protein